MPCHCSESYDRIDKWESQYYIVPSVPPDSIKETCKCYRPPGSNPFFGSGCPASGEVDDPGTFTQDPTSGTKVNVKDPRITNTSYSPQPKCGGSCNCSPGPSEVTDESTSWGPTRNIKIKIKVKGRKLKCKFDPKCKNDPALVGTPRPDGTIIGEYYEPQEWNYECPEEEIEMTLEVKEQIKKWEQTTPMTCDCQS